MSHTHDVAWCSGFFDGEGFVTIQSRNSLVSGKRYAGYYLRIGINHVAIEPLLEMQRILGGTIRKQNIDKVIGNRKQRHSWQMGTRSAAEALIRMMPYLRNKNKVAELGIELQNTMGNHGQRTTPELQIFRAMLKDQISTLNAKD
ncbi:hypothetical protein [uncultured Flavobacterium sp.]|jgi:predicted restriction endonuclease|uniref:hypothetical protein n=1 Tax=uncultured Flavobacterium sp. TaxID=165435 RepID=UPI002625DC6C|nr:hypothetical protein [uncultured Flavobacterium sp.]